MTWVAVGLAAVNVFQVVALTWIAAWQQRAAHEVRTLNGTVVEAVEQLVDSRPEPPPPAPSGELLTQSARNPSGRSAGLPPEPGREL